MKPKYKYDKPRRFYCHCCDKWFQAFAKRSSKCFNCNPSANQPTYANVLQQCNRPECTHVQRLVTCYFLQQWVCSVCGLSQDAIKSNK